MLQRIQSIYLVVAAIFLILGLFLPLWEVQAGDQSELLYGLNVASAEQEVSFYEHDTGLENALHSLFVGLSGITALFLLFTIFQFNDRKRQMRLVGIGLALILANVIALVVLTTQGPEIISSADIGRPSYGFVFPVLAIGLGWLGLRGIRKDDDLVKSMDRIR
ncbi:MAG: DUF4293 domain-containing protein [Bacteroidota bacterium]